MDEVVVEIKAAVALHPIDEAQIINSLKCSRREVGLLVNFGELKLKWRRFVASEPPLPRQCPGKN